MAIRGIRRINSDAAAAAALEAAEAAEAAAEVAAEAAEAAQQAAEDAQAAGGAGGATSVANLDPRYTNPVYADDGYIITSYDTQSVSTLGLQRDVDVITTWTGKGSRIELESVLDVVTPTVVYAGPAYDGILWLREAYVDDATGNVVAQANPNRSPNEADWIDVVIHPTNGLVIDDTLIDNYWFVSQSFGQSVDRGGTADAGGPQVITTSAIDPDNALMLGASNVTDDSPTYGQGVPYEDALVNMRHGAVTASAGESHICGMTLTVLAALDAAGGKVPFVGGSWAAGGHTCRQLEPDFAPVTAGDYASLTNIDTRVGSFYQQLLRGLQHIHKAAIAANRKPILLPLCFGGGASDAIQNWGTSAADIERFMLNLQARYSGDARRIFGWNPVAPDLPILLVQDVFQSNSMTPDASTREFGKGIDGTSLAFWSLAMKYPEKFVLAGTRYPLAHATDFTHLKHHGYFRDGEQNSGPALAGLILRRHERFNPIATYRESSTVFHVLFEWPEGDIVFDTVNVADDLDGNKNFVLWSATTNTAVTIASVALTTADTKTYVTITHTADGGELWLDHAVWKDIGFSGTRSTTEGPRGNLRTDAAHASLLPNYTDPATGLPFAAVDNFRWAPVFRIPVAKNSNATLFVDGRLQ
jgi:hypothetical protein